MTTVIQIGNSDNKLTQQDWSNFVREVDNLICDHNFTIHFRGGSDWFSPWQNACWVLQEENDGRSTTPDFYATFRKSLTEIRKRYSQDSVAFTTGETDFV